jgi:hypothetical protein
MMGRAPYLPPVALTIAILVVLATACDRAAPPSHTSPPPATKASAPSSERSLPARSSTDHDLSLDEAMGGHTLARHVGKTDVELVVRLRREPQISSASTYTDRATAESVVGAALASAGRSFDAWRNRTGRRPNFVLHFDAHRDIGRSISRGRTQAVPCQHALVVLRWDDRRARSYVLTSYPGADR